MAEISKAQITYKVGEGTDAVESILRFHGVSVEDHEVSTEITKYPVQSGFSVSNHSIKKNRKVSITGFISNHLIIGATEFHEYGGNNTRVVFDTLKNIVRGSVPCDVVTNFSNYSPVIFNKFKTKLVAGKTDMMEFTIFGEEVQLANTVNGTTPTLLIFTPVPATEREARISQLTAAGLDIPSEAVLSEAPVDLNESFQVETTGTNGKAVVVTYDKVSYDPTTDYHGFEVHTSDTDETKKEEESGIDWFSLLQEEAGVGLVAGALTTGACVKDRLTGLGVETTEDTINTALGELKKTVYGVSYGIFGVNGDKSFGQVLLALGVDCLVAGAIGTVDPDLNPDDFSDNDMPTLDDIISGAAKAGDEATTTVLQASAPTTLTKISNPDGSTSFLGDLF